MKTREQRMNLTSARLKNRTVLLFVCLSLCLLSAAQVTAQVVCTPSIKTDRQPYPKPTPPPTLPAAGGTFCDPTFGTRIMRVTDINNAPSGAGTSYSFWPTFNSNNSRILVMDPSLTPQGVIYEFNATTFTLGTRLANFPLLAGSNPPKLDDAVWSHNDPDKLFVHIDNGTKVYSYDVPNRVYGNPIIDVAPYLAPDHFITHMSVSRDDLTFAFNITRVQCDPGQDCIYPDAGYIVFRRSTVPNTPPVKLLQSAEGINEVRIDKTGRYLFVNKNLPVPYNASSIEVQIIDLETCLVTNLTDGYPNYAPSHYDVGTGIAVGAADALVGITARSMASPFGLTKILSLTQEVNGGGFHLSMLADNEDWVLVGFYTPHVNGVMQDELVQVATRLPPDGVERVRRLLHHQSVWQGDSSDPIIKEIGYYDAPHANISRDGRFIAFRSNWGRTGATTTRHDLFIAEIEPAPSLTPPQDVVWVEDAVPTGGVTGGDFEGWNWVNSNPTQFSGTLAHQSNVFAGLHQHFFNGATSTLAVNAGDTLYTYVYLDPANPPNELMLQWNNGTWEHRAYWGANNIAWGVNATDSRRYMGALPALGQWVRLEVPAAQVGLEGSTLNGMAFTLHGGRATWDRAGKSAPGTPTPTPTPTPGGDVVWIEDAIPTGGLVGGDSETWSWVSSNPSPVSGTASHQSTIAPGVHQHYFYGATATMTVNSGDRLVTDVYLDPNNVPYEIMLQWNDGSWEHRAYWGANNIPWGTDGTNSRRYMGTLPTAGQWVRLEVPASAVGLEGSTLNGMAFTLSAGRATWDRGGKSSAAPTPTPPPGTDVVWVEDAVPAGSTEEGAAEGWNWVSSNPAPVSGTAAHQSNIVGGLHQHFFYGATNGLTINAGEKLVAYVYLNPANPPTEVMLQWHDSSGSWEHRAYWGANNIPWGAEGTNSRRYMGALPATGQWVRLEVLAAQVGLEGQTINGIAFTLYGGGATWDRAGKSP